ncbi:MAG: endonuclease/exonuclease/phosphatase family protein [Myxococcota bacterium]
MRTLMRNFRVTLICALVTVMMLTGCDPFNTKFEPTEEATLYTAREKTEPRGDVETLTVMTWNVKFGGGRIDFFFDCYGDRVIMERSEVVENLEGLAEKIRQVDPDIVLLQEVDVDSKRAAFVDQLQWLLDHTDLNDGAYASQWRSSWIPRHGLGEVDSGNAIMAKWPLEDATRIALPLIDEQDFITQYFYLKRNILKARVSIPDWEPLWVFNVHTAAFAQDGTKARQIEQFKQELDKVDRRGEIFVAGGDFNTIPPGSERTYNFPDSKCEGEYEADDYREELGILGPFYNDYESAVSLDAYKRDNSPYYTHTTDKDGFWNRKLDYLFTNGDFVEGSTLTHQDTKSGGSETMPVSDHAPITVELEKPER